MRNFIAFNIEIQYYFFLVPFTAQWETESIKKGYSKVTDAYGCLGVLKVNLGKKRHLHYSVKELFKI